MIEVLSSSKSHIELKASGQITKSDYDTLIPLLERQHEQAPETNYLLRLEDFEGWEPRAFWEDLKFDWKHRDEFARAAIVADERWVEEATRFAKAVFPGDIRHFPSHQLVSARSWIRQGRHAGAAREGED